MRARHANPFTPDSGTTFLLARAAPCEGGLTLFLEDFTQRAAAEVALRRDKDLLNAVIESTTDAIFVKDLSGRYVLVNTATVVIWWVTGRSGFFWPVFLMVFWGIGLVMNAWDAYVAREITDEDIDREVSRMQRR